MTAIHKDHAIASTMITITRLRSLLLRFLGDCGNKCQICVEKILTEPTLSDKQFQLFWSFDFRR